MRMSRVEQLEDQVKSLSRRELEEFRTWFSDFDADLWDQQIEAHAADGTLDRLAKRALEEYEAGLTSRL